MQLFRSLPLVAVLALSAGAMPALAQAPSPVAPKAMQADESMRDLWVDHIFWVRNVVIDTLAHNQMAAAIAEAQVVDNAKQIAGAIEPFYGKAASEQLFTLLAGHYGAIKQYLDAGTNQAAKNAATAAATKNVDQIAAFLAGANPNLPEETLKALLNAHVAQHEMQIDELRAKQYQKEAETWEMMKGHMYMIADALTGAVAKQFPAKFV
ncbi:MAG TPA: hypothetical protein VIZ17_19065 [Acetobacteraceae bacterium]